MKAWLTRNFDARSRIFVAVMIWAWMVGIGLLLVWQYNANIRRGQQDHHDIQSLMKAGAVRDAADATRKGQQP